MGVFKKGKSTILVVTEDSIEKIKGDPVGRPFPYGNSLVYMASYEGDKLIPFDPLIRRINKTSKTPHYTPEDLYDALDWTLAKMVYKVQNDLLSKINTGLMVAMVGILCFFIYLIYSSVGG